MTSPKRIRGQGLGESHVKNWLLIGYILIISSISVCEAENLFFSSSPLIFTFFKFSMTPDMPTGRDIGGRFLTIKSSGLVIFSLRKWRSCSVLNGPSLWNVIFHSLKKRSMSWYLSFRYSRNTSRASVSSSAKKKNAIHFVTFPLYRSHCKTRDFHSDPNVKTDIAQITEISTSRIYDHRFPSQRRHQV